MTLFSLSSWNLYHSWTLTDIVHYTVVASSILAISILLKAIYNLTLHPLASYPGPLLNRAFSLPQAWSIVSGDGPRHIHQLHEKYGPVVRIGPNHLSYTDVRAWKDIYGHRTGSNHSQLENIKSDVHYNNFPGEAKNILVADRDEHARLRRALANGFSDKSMREQQPMIMKYVDLLLARLHQVCEAGRQEVDLTEWYNWTTFDIVGDLVFAEGFGCLENSRGHIFVDLITDTVKQASLILAISYVGLRWLVAPIVQRSGASALIELGENLEKKLRYRLTVKDERADLFEGLMKRRDEWNLDLAHLGSNAGLLVAAGSETTASLLTGATYLLLTNPESMLKLQQEVRSTFNSAEEITLTSVNRLPYMLACLNEALRMYPPAASNLAREVHEGGEVIAGKFVPENMMVEVQQYAMNYSSEHWHDAYSFRPERFLHKFDTEGNYEQSSDPNQDCFEALQPFSFGPRNCIGRNLAYAEMRLILARIVYDFDLKLADNAKGWMDRMKVYHTWARQPLHAYLTPVQRK